jgi:hypothetical protein
LGTAVTIDKKLSMLSPFAPIRKFGCGSTDFSGRLDHRPEFPDKHRADVNQLIRYFVFHTICAKMVDIYLQPKTPHKAEASGTLAEVYKKQVIQFMSMVSTTE